MTDAVGRARKAGDLEERLAKARREAVALEREAAIALGRLTLWQGTLDELARLPVPAAETIERFARNFADSEQHLATARHRIEERAGDIASITGKIEQLRSEGEVPSEADLEARRQRRDAGWQLVRRAWLTGNVEGKQVEAYLDRAGENEDLADAYRDSVRAADATADGLRSQADRVARQAALQAQLEDRRRDLAERQAEQTAAETKRGQLERDWHQQWGPIGIEPLPVKEMSRWLTRHKDLVAQAAALRDQRADIDALAGRVAETCQEIGRQVEALGGESSVPDESLAALLDRAESLAARIDQAARNRDALEQRMPLLTAEQAELDNQAGQAAGELADWQTRWTAAVEPLGLPEDASPEQANEVLARIGEMLQGLHEVHKIAGRIAAIDDDARHFEEFTSRLAKRVAPDLAAGGLSGEPLAEELLRRHKQAERDHQTLENLRKQLAESIRQHQEACTNAEDAKTTLTHLCRDAGGVEPEELPEIERAWAEKKLASDKLEALEEQLRHLGRGMTLEQLGEESAAAGPEESTARLDELAERIDGLEPERDRLIGEISVLCDYLDNAGRGEETIDAAERSEGLLSRLEGDVGRYYRLKLAALVLRRGIEGFRRQNEGPMLERASRHFARLTCGAFAKLRVDCNERNETVLLGVRGEGTSAGRGTVGVAGMSDGSADQLYLALRLANLESWLDRGEPMPLILDDIAVNFDDRRAAATLEVLAELSRRAQIVFFTHHRHLVELAKTDLDADDLVIHDLSAAALPVSHGDNRK